MLLLLSLVWLLLVKCCRGEEDYFSSLEGVFEESCRPSSVFLESSLDQAALAVAREFLDEKSCRDEYQPLDENDAYGAFRSAAEAAAGVEKAIALAIVLLVIEHGAAPFDDPEIVELCRSLDVSSRNSLVTSLEDYFGDFYATAALELGSLRFSLLEEAEDDLDPSERVAEDSVELWIDVLFFLVVFGVACALSATLRKFYRLAASCEEEELEMPCATKPNNVSLARGEPANYGGGKASSHRKRHRTKNKVSAPPSTIRRRKSEEEHVAASSSSEEEEDDDESDRGLVVGEDQRLVAVVPTRTPSSTQVSQRWKKKRERKEKTVDAPHQQTAARKAAPDKRPPPVVAAQTPPAALPKSGSSKPATSAKVDRRSFAQAALGHAPPPASSSAASSVKVVPLPPNVDDLELRSRFARYGGVLGARVFRDADPPHGYVDFDCRAKAVAAAFDANGRSLFGDGDERVACIVRERAMSADLSDNTNRRLYQVQQQPQPQQ